MLRGEPVKLPFTSVVSYHTNPMTCGVAKFSKLLAERIGVPFVSADLMALSEWGPFPLFSFKASELPTHKNQPLMRVFSLKCLDRYGVFWHDAGIRQISDCADVIFYADPSLGSPGLWCPSLLTPSRPRVVNLFAFGMAGRLQTAHCAKVRQLLDAAGLDYRLRLSVGLHEGTTLDAATRHFDALKDVMGADKVTILGCLSDDAVAEELQRADYVLAFFDRGLRANNTTVHAALHQRRPVVTNHDEHTPEILREITMDVNGSLWIDWLRGDAHVYSWKRLISEMAKVCAASQSATA